MAKINVATSVTAPAQINIPLIRADHAETSGIFRVCFEVALSIFSTLLGYTLGLKEVQIINWIFLAITFIGMAAFLRLSFNYGRASKVS